jgi:hypothetical protein
VKSFPWDGKRRIGARLVGVLALLSALSALSGCVSFTHVAKGEVTVRERMAVVVDRPWNQFDSLTGDKIPTWTQEGLTLDTLRFFVGIQDGQLLVADTGNRADRPLVFRGTMQADDIAGLFGAYYSRGGSSFDLEAMRPASFLGLPGFRFEFNSVRKSDDVRLKGVVWAAVRDKELFAISFTAPRLTFFPRELPQAEKLATSARLLK